MNASPFDDITAKCFEVFGKHPDLVWIRFPGVGLVKIAPTVSPLAGPKKEELSAEDLKRFQKWKDRILPYLKVVGIPLNRKQIASGLKLTKNTAKGWFCKSINLMVESGELKQNDRRCVSVTDIGLKEIEAAEKRKNPK